jgi:hypothetical protein
MRSFRVLVPVSLCGLVFALTAVGGFGSPVEGLPVPTVPTTLPQVTTPPTLAPVTLPPTTLPPVTVAPVTLAPVTLPPVTVAPVTTPLVTLAPVTLPPVTLAPVTLPPVTVAPVTLPPVTVAPVTLPPVTVAPGALPSITLAPAPAPAPGAAPTSPPVPGAATAPSATVAGALPSASSPAGAPVAGAVPSVTSPTSAAVVPSLGGTTVTVPTRIPYAPVGPIFGTLSATAEAALGDTPSVASVGESGAPSAQSSSESVDGAQPTARRGDPTAAPRPGGEAVAGSDGGVPEGASFVSGSRWCDDADALAPWLADLLCPKVASSPAARDDGGLLDGVFPFVGGTVGTLIVIALVALACGFALKRLGRPSEDRDASATPS